MYHSPSTFSRHSRRRSQPQTRTTVLTLRSGPFAETIYSQGATIVEVITVDPVARTPVTSIMYVELSSIDICNLTPLPQTNPGCHPNTHTLNAIHCDCGYHSTRCSAGTCRAACCHQCAGTLNRVHIHYHKREWYFPAPSSHLPAFLTPSFAGETIAVVDTFTPTFPASQAPVRITSGTILGYSQWLSAVGTNTVANGAVAHRWRSQKSLLPAALGVFTGLLGGAWIALI